MRADSTVLLRMKLFIKNIKDKDFVIVISSKYILKNQEQREIASFAK
jgi:hypothetical protein